MLIMVGQNKHVIPIRFDYNRDNKSMADKKQKREEEQAKLRLEKERLAMQEHKQAMMPLVKFLKKQKLPFKYARVGANRIEYFRLDDFNKLKELSRDQIQAHDNIRQLFDKCESQQCFIFYRRPPSTKNLKYPHSLEPVAGTDVEAKFCSFKFDTTLSQKGLMFSIVAGALALVLLPVWPFSVKYAIWIISLYLLVFLVGLLAFRLALYLLCVVAGFNVWIFPNLLGDYGFFESFKPIFYAERWEQSRLNIVIRVAAFLILSYYGAQLYLDPSFLESHFTVTKGTIEDIHDWGVSKIKNEVKFSEKAITNLEHILNETADVEDQREPGQSKSKSGREGEGEEGEAVKSSNEEGQAGEAL